MHAVPPLTQLIFRQNALLCALDMGDLFAVEAATADVAQILPHVAQNAFIGTEARWQLDHALTQARAVHQRVKFLTARLQRRAERLTQRQGERTLEHYINPAKLRLIPASERLP